KKGDDKKDDDKKGDDKKGDDKKGDDKKGDDKKGGESGSGSLDTPDDLMKESVALLNDTSDVLEKIKTKADAEKFKDELKKLGDRGKTVQEQSKKLKMEALPKDKQEALQKKFKDDLEKGMKRLSDAMKKLPKDPEVLGALKDLNLGM